MSEHYDDAILIAATDASNEWDADWTGSRSRAQQILDAVAPLIAAKALRDAARKCRGSDMLPAIPRSRVRAWLGDLAGEIERGRS